MSTVLIVEDYPSNMQVFSALLWSMGHRVLEAATVAEALTLCQTHEGPIGLVIADLALPDGSGTEVALAVTRSCPDAAVLFVSGMPLNAWPVRDRRHLEALPAGVGVLEKPFRPAALTAKVDELLHTTARHNTW